MKKLKLGLKVKDRVTNFEGITVAECKYNGCTIYEVQSIVKKDNEWGSFNWIDAQQLKIAEE